MDYVWLEFLCLSVALSRLQTHLSDFYDGKNRSFRYGSHVSEPLVAPWENILVEIICTNGSLICLLLIYISYCRLQTDGRFKRKFVH
jgi:hypothetical protein